MVQNNQTPATQVDPLHAWKLQTQQTAQRTIAAMLGTNPRAKLAAGRVIVALSAALTANPTIANCTPESVTRCIAQAALTDIMPGGSFAKAYLVPKKTGGVLELNYWVSHRGIMEFANRAGNRVTCSFVHVDDEFAEVNGVIEHKSNPDRICHVDWSSIDRTTLRGIIVRAFPVEHPTAKVERWVPMATINERRLKSDTKDGKFSPWNNWPLEMCEKTAIKYCAARGLFPMNDAAEYLQHEDDGASEVAKAVRAEFMANRPAEIVNESKPDTGAQDIKAALGEPDAVAS